MPETSPNQQALRGIGSWLTLRAQICPEREAVVDGERRLSYAQLNQRVNRLARALQARGLAYGDRLAMLSYNRLEFIEIIMACAKLGLVLVPLNWRLTAAELSFQLGDSQTHSLVFDPGLAELAQGVMQQAELDFCLAVGQEEALGAHAYEALLAAQPGTNPRPPNQ